MKYIPPKYRFFIIKASKEVEVFPAHNPGSISFSKTFWNEYTEDFKLIANDDFTFHDDSENQNTETKLYKPFQFFETQASAFIQSIDFVIKESIDNIYKIILNGKIKVIDPNPNAYNQSQRKFTTKIETTSKHQDLENIFDTDVNILETDVFYKKTARLVSSATDYDNCFSIEGVIQHILTTLNTGVTVRDDPFPFITTTLLIENLLIADKTDIKRPNSTSNATILNFTLGRILKVMRDLFNLRYRLTPNNALYFEHPTEKSTLENNILDSQIINLITRTYGYVEYPKSMLFKYEEADTSGFIQQLIEFQVNEGTQDQYSADNINADLQFIINNNTAIGADSDAKDEVADTGACLIGCDSSLNIYEVAGIKNSKLQLTELIQNCFYFDLYFNDFTQNGVSKSITSNKKRKKTVINLKKYSNFDENKLINTSFGIGEIVKINISGDKMNLEIEY